MMWTMRTARTAWWNWAGQPGQLTKISCNVRETAATRQNKNELALSARLAN